MAFLFASCEVLKDHFPWRVWASAAGASSASVSERSSLLDKPVWGGPICNVGGSLDTPMQRASWVWLQSLKHHMASGACKQSCVFCSISIPQQVLDGVMHPGGALEWPAWKSVFSPKLLLFVMDVWCSSWAPCSPAQWGGCEQPSGSQRGWLQLIPYWCLSG